MDRQQDQKVVAAIRDAGIAVSSVWDLVHTRERYPEAVSALVAMLPKVQDLGVKEGIARALTVKEASPLAVTPLVEEFRELSGNPNAGALLWAIGNALSVLARKEHAEELIDLLKRPEGGAGRQMIASTFGRLKDPRAIPVLIDLLDEPTIAGHAAGALGNMRAIEARPHLERVAEEHPNPWVRKVAKKSLEKIAKGPARKRSSRSPSVLLALFLLAAAAGPAAAASLRLTVGPSGLSVSGISPKGRAVLFGITREVAPDDVATILPHLDVLSDDDGDGAVSKDLGQPMPRRSMWVAVDLASGDFDAAAPERFRLQKVGWKGRGLDRRPDGRDQVEDARPFAEVLVVRPGVGAWTLRLGDGGPGDADGAADGRIAAALDRLEPLAGSPAPPSRFAPGDVVLLLDPNAMEMVLVKVGKERK